MAEAPEIANYDFETAQGPAEQWILPGCGHSPHRECPDALIQRVHF